MNSEDYLGWIYLGGGLELYNDLLQKELKMNVVVFPTFGETPEPQGWFQQTDQERRGPEGPQVPGDRRGGGSLPRDGDVGGQRRSRRDRARRSSAG